ncbi:lysophospholipid acyltransferase family protein [Deinococcus psychrotolerans]|uniref:lysophospholipid acyltransferase family protein n=1 Tax=Deinococcus psychrotolerans TaxID=2489213 RepID=UPI001F14ADD5|nr:lysophospholipid acyltransferase family protein [Deinococcus psychrotolerans]
MPPPITPHPDDPVELHFAPEGLATRLRFALLGRPLIWSRLKWAQRFPESLTPAQRLNIQRTLSRRILAHLKVKLELHGLENIGPTAAVKGPYLIASLHEGIADVPCLLQLPLMMRFVARREIFTWPEIGPVLSKLGHVSINPEHPLGGFRDLLRGAEEILGGGESLVTFPQGTIAGIQSDFQRGVFEVAKRLGVPILPVALTGAHRIWEHPFAPTLRSGVRVGLRVLPPISAEEVRSAHPETLRVRTRRAVKAAAMSAEMPPARFFDPERDGYWDGYKLDIDPDFPGVAHQMSDHRAAFLKGTA